MPSRGIGFYIEDGCVVTFENTDGDYSRRPSNTSPEVGNDGEVNYMAPADEGKLKDWKVKIAKGLVERSSEVQYDPGRRYILRDLPIGYALFTHRKGPRHTPRTDTYLYGSKYVTRFRSPEEFVPHAKWIAEGCRIDRDGIRLCECEYCSKGRPKRIRSNSNRASRSGAMNTEREIAAKDYTGIAGGQPSAITFPHDWQVRGIPQAAHETTKVFARNLQGVGGALMKTRN